MTSILSMLLNSALPAAPDPPFEDLLLRAKNVLVAQVILTSSDQRTVSFQPVTVLRGNMTEEFSLSVESYIIFKKGSQWLLLSQGDNRYGEPRAVLGRTMEGQQVWRGWIPLPLSRVGERTYAAAIFSICDGPPFWDIQSPSDGPSLELSRIKRLVQRFPYNPSINGT
jgi:hypothetical protein